MRKTVQTILLLMLAMILVAGISSCSKNSDQEAAAKEMNSSGASDYAVMALDGGTIQLSDFRGKVVILDFWDTWCPPCRREIPHFVELYNEYNKDGLEILGVAFGREGMQAIKDFVKEFNIPYKNAVANEQIMKGFGPINSIPTTFVLDQKGNVYKKYIGYNDKSTFEADIKALLN